MYVQQVLLPELTECIFYSLYKKKATAYVTLPSFSPTVPDPDPVIIRFEYQSVLPQLCGLCQVLKIKISCRPCQHTSVVIRQKPLLNSGSAVLLKDNERRDSSASVFIKVAPPKQTLMEKMLLLHECFHLQTVARRHLTGQSRHLLDIARLVSWDPGLVSALQVEEFNRLLTHRRFWYRQKEVNYAQIKMSRLCFIPPLEVLGALMDDFRQLRQLYLLTGSYDYATLIGQIQTFNDQLNGHSWPKAKMELRRK